MVLAEWVVSAIGTVTHEIANGLARLIARRGGGGGKKSARGRQLRVRGEREGYGRRRMYFEKFSR